MSEWNDDPMQSKEVAGDILLRICGGLISTGG